MAKVTKYAIQKKLQDKTELSVGEMNEILMKKFKKDIKREQILETYNLHRYHLTKKEKRIAKAKLARLSK